MIFTLICPNLIKVYAFWHCIIITSCIFSTQDSKGTCISIASLEHNLVRVNETLANFLCSDHARFARLQRFIRDCFQSSFFNSPLLAGSDLITSFWCHVIKNCILYMQNWKQSWLMNHFENKYSSTFFGKNYVHTWRCCNFFNIHMFQ